MKKIVNHNQKFNLEYSPEQIINCKLCQREIIIASEIRRLNIWFYDCLTSYSFCSAKCFNRKAETYQEWVTTFDDKEDTD